MKSTPKKTPQSDDLFRSRLDQIINLKHELVLLADRIDWSYLDDQVAPFYAMDGRPSIPSRLMIGQFVAFSISGQQVARFLSQLIDQRSRPDQIICDNGTEVV